LLVISTVSLKVVMQNDGDFVDVILLYWTFDKK